MSNGPSTPPRKLITVPLIDYLEALWASRDIAYVDIIKAEQLRAIDNDEQFCHVRMPSKELGISVPEVWRKVSWDSDTLHREEEKKRSALHQAKVERWKEARERLADSYISMGLFASHERELAKQKATFLLNKHQVQMAKILGVDIQEFADDKFTYFELGDMYKGDLTMYKS